MQSARVPMALAPTDGNTGGGVPDEAPGAGPLEVYPLDDACRCKSLKSNRRADCDVPANCDVPPGAVPARPRSPRFCPTASFHDRPPRFVVGSSR